MIRLIDADALLKYIEGNNTEREWVVNNYNADWIWSFIDSAQTIDAEPVRHGHWADRHVTDFGVAEEFCGRCEEWSVGWHKRYCPNCGAKMDEVNNNERD